MSRPMGDGARPLEGVAPAPFPTAPRDLVASWSTVSEKVRARFLRWVETPEGARILAELERRALARANSGARHIEINDVVADVRKDWTVSINNSHRSCISRWLIQRYAFLGTLIECRGRSRAG